MKIRYFASPPGILIVKGMPVPAYPPSSKMKAVTD